MDQLMPLVQAVVRGTRTALIAADLPLGAYQGSAEQALDSAVRYLKEGGAQAVKLEGGQAVLPAVQMMTQAGIPVMGHLGLTPQSVHVLGGTRRVQGRGSGRGPAAGGRSGAARFGRVRGRPRGRSRQPRHPGIRGAVHSHRRDRRGRRMRRPDPGLAGPRRAHHRARPALRQALRRPG
jgi:hypothetical protein